MNEMTLSFTHIIKNAGSGGLRSSTLPLGQNAASDSTAKADLFNKYLHLFLIRIFLISISTEKTQDPKAYIYHQLTLIINQGHLKIRF